MVRVNYSFNQNSRDLLRRRWPREAVEKNGYLEFLQEMRLLGGHVGVTGGYEEGKESDEVCRSNGRGREQRLTASGALVGLSLKTKAEHPETIEIKYCK